VAERRKVFELRRLSGPRVTRDSAPLGADIQVRQSKPKLPCPPEIHHPEVTTGSCGNSIAQGRLNNVANLRLAFERGNPHEVRTKIMAKRSPEKQGRRRHSHGRNPTTPPKKYSRDEEVLGQDSATFLQRRESTSHPLLRPHIISVKISTAVPQSTLEVDQIQGNASPQHRTGHSDLVLADNARPMAPGLDRGHEPAMLMALLRRQRRELPPVKSAPSLPITVSTTIAVTSRRASSSSSLLGDSDIDPFDCRDLQKRALTEAPMLFNADAPGTPPQTVRSQPQREMESPVKKTITLFENLSHTAVDSAPWAAPGRSKSYDCVAVVEGEKGRGLLGAQFKRGSRLSRILSFGSNMEGMDQKLGRGGSLDTVGSKSTRDAKRESNTSGSRSSISSSSWSNPRRGYSPFRLQPFSKQVPVATATIYKVASHDGCPEQPLPEPGLWSSVDLVVGPVTEDYLPSPMIASEVSSFVGAPYYPPKNQDPSSFGKKNTDSMKRRVARPVLTHHEGRAVPSRRSNLNVSWGRRAAAAAFAIGKRLKERRTSKTQSEASREDGASGSRPISPRED